VVRTRRNTLFTFGATRLPYVFLGDAAVNEGDVVLRHGEVTVDPPRILAPRDPVELEGFDLEDEDEGAIPVVLNRWVRFPPAKYQNSSSSMEISEGPLEAVTDRILRRLDDENDSRTGVIQGPSEMWGFSILGYVGQMIVRSAPENVGEFFERMGFGGAE
jgi:hypothetical protein